MYRILPSYKVNKLATIIATILMLKLIWEKSYTILLGYSYNVGNFFYGFTYTLTALNNLNHEIINQL